MANKSQIMCFLWLLSFSPGVMAQESEAKEADPVFHRKNSLYFEIMGNAAVWSVNYDRIIAVKNGFGLVLRAGGNEYHSQHTDQLSFNLIGAAGVVLGAPTHFFESTFGYTHFSSSSDKLMTLTAGYRFMGRNGLVIRLSPMYIVNTEKGDTFGNNLWFGLSLGYCF